MNMLGVIVYDIYKKDEIICPTVLFQAWVTHLLAVQLILMLVNRVRSPVACYIVLRNINRTDDHSGQEFKRKEERGQTDSLNLNVSRVFLLNPIKLTLCLEYKYPSMGDYQ